MAGQFNRKKRRFASAAIGVLMLITAACGGTADQEKSNSGEQGTNPEGGAYVVQHAMGETPIPATPKRVVVLTNEGTEAVLAMGVKPVGANNSHGGDPFFPHLMDKLEGVTPVGKEDQPNLEAIAALQPDLIIGNKMRHEKVYEQLSALAPTVFAETLRGEWRNNFELYAKALNKQDIGEKVLADFDKRIEDFRSKAGDKLNTEVSMVRFMPGKVRIYYNDTFSGVMFKKLGLKRPAAQDKEEFAAEVSKERIPEMDGDILFYFTYETGDGTASALEKEWLNDPLWNNLEVVKNNKAFKVDDVTWNTAGGILSANIMLDDLYGYFDIAK